MNTGGTYSPEPSSIGPTARMFLRCAYRRASLWCWRNGGHFGASPEGNTNGVDRVCLACGKRWRER